MPLTEHLFRSKRARDIGLLAVLVVALCSAARAAVTTHDTSSPTTRPLRADAPVPLGRSASDAGPTMPSFAFRDQRGQLVEKRDLLGHVWIADFIYTSCQNACPLLTSRLVTVQRRIPDKSLQFVSFSVDPDTDTPEALAQYARRWNGAELRWHLLSTDNAGLARLTSSMKLALSGTGGEIVHSDRFFLIGPQGDIAGSFDSSNDGAIEQLVAEAGKLLGEAPVARLEGSTGRELFSSLSCGGCHDDSQLAPPLMGLSGTHVMLERGNVMADDDYIRESISTPAAKLVAGYPNSMPAYGSMLSADQLDHLVGYVRSLHGARPAEHATMSQVDPVCGMPVRVAAGSPSAEYRGQTYHFCSAVCARHFHAEPEKYLRAN